MAAGGGAPAFSASEAALEGFRVIRAHWRLVAGWGLFNLLALAAIIALVVILFVAAIVAAGDPERSAVVVGLVGAGAGALGVVTTTVLVAAALYRLILRPGPPGFLYLRIGGDEGRLLLVWLGLGGGFLLLAAVAALLSWGALMTAGPLAALLTAFVAATALLVVAVRFSLAGPMTIAEGRIRLLGAWSLTRGRTLPLTGMGLLVFCFQMMVLIAGWIVLSLVIGGVFGLESLGAVNFEDASALTDHPGAYLTQMTADIVFAPVLLVISQAPLAAAYKAFTGTPPPQA